MSATMTLTADDFLALGESEERMELIEGEIVHMNSPRFRHQDLIGRMLLQLMLWCEAAAGRGYAGIEFDHRVDDRNVFVPDVWWLREERVPHDESPHMLGPPDLAIEVRSKSTWAYDIGDKKDAYERNGLPELWLVDTTAECVLVYRRSNGDAPAFDVELAVQRNEVLTSPQLPGFALDVGALFKPRRGPVLKSQRGKL